MPDIKAKRSDVPHWAALLLVLALTLILSSLFPLTGDDWFREELAGSISSPAELMRTVIYKWQTVNSRILGNVLAYTAAGHPVFRALLRGAIMFLTVLAVAKVSGLEKSEGLLLTAACVIALPCMLR